MKQFILAFLLGVFFFNGNPLMAQTTILVGATDSEIIPFIFKDGSGLGTDLVDLLNTVQRQYQFEYIILPFKRTYKEFYSGKLHMVAFQSVDWGWDKSRVFETYKLVRAKDVYIALKKPGRDESFFDGVGNLSTIGVFGYFYKYAEYITDHTILINKYNTLTVKSEGTVIQMLLRRRGEIGIISSTLLDYKKLTEQEVYNKFLISIRHDSEYSTNFIISKTAPVSPKEINKFWVLLKNNGLMAKAFKKYGLTPPVIP
jgi:hypothetical protein